MCRFIAYLGEPILLSKILVEPENSLITQSHKARERNEPLNGDGFGVGWFIREIRPEPGLFRSTRPAWSDANLKSICEVTRSECFLAHVRAATFGEVMETSCHPFRFKNLLMMHNGSVGNFTEIKKPLLCNLPNDLFNWVRGQTDSEHFFALLLSNLRYAEIEKVEVEEVRVAFVKALEQVRAYQRQAGGAPDLSLNLAISNGRWLFASKYSSESCAVCNTLYYSVGTIFECDKGVCSMRRNSHQNRSTMIVSEKLTDLAEDWIAIPNNSVVMVDSDHQPRVEPIQS